MIEQFLKRKELEAAIKLSRSAIYAAMRAGTFPKPIRIGKTAVAWRASDIEAWQVARIAESQAGKAA